MNNGLSKKELEILELLQKEEGFSFDTYKEVINDRIPPKPQNFVPKKGNTILKNGDEAIYCYDLDLVEEDNTFIWKPSFKIFNKTTRKLEVIDKLN